jgi:uncharacterized protein YndB with AHSA1/START domain
MPDVTVSRRVSAPAGRVWELVSDLPRMGEWSPENQGGKWVGGATGPAPGARFRGNNEHRGRAWKTDATVVEADPGRRFSFRISALRLPVADWAYEIEPTEEGCVVTETWTDRRPSFFKPIGNRLTKVDDRATHNRATMETTLERLAAAAES